MGLNKLVDKIICELNKKSVKTIFLTFFMFVVGAGIANLFSIKFLALNREDPRFVFLFTVLAVPWLVACFFSITNFLEPLKKLMRFISISVSTVLLIWSSLNLVVFLLANQGTVL